MPSLVEQLSSITRFVAHRETREREDAAALSELASVPLPLPPGLELGWLGVAGYPPEL